MPNEREVGIRITGKDELTPDAQRAAASIDALGKETENAGRAAEGMSRKAEDQSGVLRNLGSSVMSMVTSWLGFTAIASSIYAVFDEIAARARRAIQAVADTGREVRALSANVGGEEATAAFDELTLIAAEQKLGVSGRSELLKGITAATDTRGNLTREEIKALGNNLATLQRASSVGGETGFAVIQSLVENAQLSDEQAVDTASVLLNSGISAQVIQDIASTGGGIELLSLVQAARQRGLDASKVNEGVNSLTSALGRRDADGRLAEDLREAGLSGDQSIVERFRTLVQARDEGRISEGQFRALTGGEQLARIVDPFARVLSTPGALESAARDLLDEDAAERTIAEISKNPYVRAAERIETGKLARKVSEETSGLTDVGAELADFEVDFEGSNAVVRLAGQVGNIPAYLNPRDPDLIEALRQRQIRQSLGRPVKPLQRFIDDFAESRRPERDGVIPVSNGSSDVPVGDGQATVVNNYYETTNITNQYNADDPTTRIGAARRVYEE